MDQTRRAAASIEHRQLGWRAIAIVCDYVLLAKLLAPPDGYYKLDVYIYYLSIPMPPVAAALLRRRKA